MELNHDIPDGRPLHGWHALIRVAAITFAMTFAAVVGAGLIALAVILTGQPLVWVAVSIVAALVAGALGGLLSKMLLP